MRERGRVLRLEQQGDHDCFVTAVACITEVPREYLPPGGTTVLPLDLLGVWGEWAKDAGYGMHYSREDPGGICVANIIVESPWAEEHTREYDVEVTTHAVVWDGEIIWDPLARVGGRNLRGVHSYVKIERT